MSKTNPSGICHREKPEADYEYFLFPAGTNLMTFILIKFLNEFCKHQNIKKIKILIINYTL